VDEAFRKARMPISRTAVHTLQDEVELALFRMNAFKMNPLVTGVRADSGKVATYRSFFVTLREEMSFGILITIEEDLA
jgi:hypothetical protein